MTTISLISRSLGSFSSRNARAPMFCKPMALSIPAAVSYKRGGGLPIMGSRESPLTTKPPSWFRCTTSSNSTPFQVIRCCNDDQRCRIAPCHVLRQLWQFQKCRQQHRKRDYDQRGPPAENICAGRKSKIGNREHRSYGNLAPAC